MKAKWIAFVAAFALMTGCGALLLRLKASQKLGLPGVKLDLPERVAEFTSEILPVTEEEIGALPRDTTFGRRLYSQVENGQTNQIQLGIVLMGSDRTSLHKPQFCLVGQGWRIDKTEHVTLPISRPHAYDLPVMKLTASMTLPDGRPARGIYLYWFVADNCLTADHWQRMWWMSRHLLVSGTLQRWAYVNCFGVCSPGQEELTFARMQHLVTNAVPEFQLASGPIRTAARRPRP